MFLTLTLILIVTPFLYWYYTLYKFRSLTKLPGPKSIPIIGTTPPRDPHDIFKTFNERKSTYGNIYKLFIGPQLRVVTSHLSIVEKLLSSNVHITKSNLYHCIEPLLQDGLVTSKNPKWKERRRIITPCFYFQIMDKFVKNFNVSTDILIDKLYKEVGKKSVDVYSFCNLFALDVICETAMGTKINAQANSSVPYVLATRQFLNIFIERAFSFWKISETLYYLFAQTSNQLKECLKILHGFSHDVINKRITELHKNDSTLQKKDEFRKERFALLDTLLKSDNNLTNEDINEEINTFMIAGHDTMSSALSFALLHLAKYPDVQNTLYQEIIEIVGPEKSEITVSQLGEMKYLDMVVKETLRLTPPVPVIERQLQENFECEGIQYPKGTIITINIYGIHSDPEIYLEPEKFDPERFSLENQKKRSPYAFIPFSAGPRNCIGQRFALLEMKCALTKIIQNFKLKLAQGYKEDLYMCGVLKSANGICLQLQARNTN